MYDKVCPNMKTPTPTHIPSSVQLSTWGRLGDSATNSFYTFCYMLIVLKSFLWAKQNLTVFEKCPFFHTQLLPKILKLHIKFEVVFSYKDCI